MKALRFPIISITLFFAAGILAGYGLSISIEFIYPFLAIALTGLITAYAIAKKQLLPKPWFGMATWLFAFAVGMLVQHLHYPPNQQLHYTHQLKNGETPVLKTVVSERLKPNEFSEKYYFEMLAADGKPASGKLLVTVPRDSLHKLLTPGDAYYIAGGLKPIQGALNPYQFDYSGYMEKQGVFHQVRLKDNFAKAGHINTFDSYVGSLREKLIRSFDIHDFDAKTRNVINALLLGQRQDMDKETTESYANAGVLHILAISGLHFSMLFYILTLLLRPLNRFRRRGELLQLFLILALLWGFAFITGLSASVVRSVVMFSIILIGQYANRTTNIYNSLALSMLVLLLARPMFLFDVGFQLSYIAVFSIVWLQPLYKKARVSKYAAVNYAIDTVLISLAAQIGVLPLSLYYFNQFPLLFMAANLVVIPLSNVILVLGLIVLLLNFIAPPVAIFLGHALEWLIMGMNAFIARVASFDKLVLKDIPFTLLLNISLYTILILMVLWLFRKSYARTAAVLVAILAFQGIYTLTVQDSKTHDELVVFNNWDGPLLAVKEDSRITVYSNDSLALQSPVVKSYRKGSFAGEVSIKPLRSLLWHNGSKVLVVDSAATYSPQMKPDVLVLTHSPKVNLERLLSELKPKQVVADASNYKSYIARWEATCQKQKIPFHATAEKGSFRIE
ncbi:ComEC family competence protein [Flavobacterium sp. MFBS3-15]|uniref:ComEC/Rec2 family competence protein n=1 Tax=Flavobacterium sp. MFBS3-15 TaxID=2989816 RepID=UPI002235C3BB|nr:ComEC/Rec2 family competence protein [Flavobacterium sp. MFBS3-15]MCW4468706.1 ComEC family competence protein [Flavobacterium sp. MFBS3-15]